MGQDFAARKTVKHGGREYVGKDGQTTNNVENFFLQFKRGMRGTYIHCEVQHLQRNLKRIFFLTSVSPMENGRRCTLPMTSSTTSLGEP